jgi:hypothetical protein
MNKTKNAVRIGFPATLTSRELSFADRKIPLAHLLNSACKRPVLVAALSSAPKGTYAARELTTAVVTVIWSAQ